MAERHSQGEETTREATSKRSTSPAARFAEFRAATRAAGGLALAVTAVGAIAGLLLVSTVVAPVAKVEVASGSCQVINDADPKLADRCVLSGWERHGPGLLILGLGTLLMAYGAGLGGSRPAAGALIAMGAVALGVGLLVDLPETSKTGLIGLTHSEAKGLKGVGFWLEIAAGGLASAAGLVRLLRPS